MAAGPHAWSTNPANNGTIDGRAQFPPGMNANAVDGSVRGLMASVALARDDNLGVALTAALTAGNTTNSFTLTTGQGLIDPTSIAGGGAARITHPFSLTINFATAPTGMATNPLKLAIDGAALAAVTRLDGSALVDGDIKTTRPYAILGYGFTAGVLTQIRIAEIVPSDILGLLPAPAVAAGAKITVPAAQNIVPSYARTKVTNFGPATDGTGGKASFDVTGARLLLGVGSWLLTARLRQDMPIGVNYSYTLDVCRNGVSQPELKLSQTNSTIDYTPTGGNVPAVLQVSANDYFETFATHNYGSSNPLDFRVELVAVYLGA